MVRDDTHIPSALDSQERWAGELTSVVKRLVSDVVAIQEILEQLRIDAGRDEQAGSSREEKIVRLETCVTDLYNKLGAMLQSCASKHGELASFIADVRSIKEDIRTLSTKVTQLTSGEEASGEDHKLVVEHEKTLNNWKGRMWVILGLAALIPIIVEILLAYFKK